MSILERVEAERVPHWTCSECGTTYFGASKFLFCPKCRDAREAKRLEYWAKETASQRSVASDIVNRILAGKSNGSA